MVQGTMESTVRQRKKENPEESGDEKEAGVGDNVCLYQRKSLWSFLLALDVHLTKRLALCTDKGDRLGSLRPVMKFLEFSCHGIPWIFGNVIAILYFKDKGTLELLVNLFFALIFDVLVVAVVKLIFRRPRPAHNQMDMFATVSVDKYSFPSGHTTRAAMLAFFFLHYLVLATTFRRLLILWAGAVALSRVLLGRHHVGDVMCGLVIGYFQYKMVVSLWLPWPVCMALLNPIL